MGIKIARHQKTSGEKPQYLHIYNISSLIVLFLPLESNVYFIFFYFAILAGVFELANCQENCNTVDIRFSLNFWKNRVVFSWNNSKIFFSNFQHAATQKAGLRMSPAWNQSNLLLYILRIARGRVYCNYYFIFIYFSYFYFCFFT